MDFCKQYVTEKFWLRQAMKVVPVVMGPSGSGFMSGRTRLENRFRVVSPTKPVRTGVCVCVRGR